MLVLQVRPQRVRRAVDFTCGSLHLIGLEFLYWNSIGMRLNRFWCVCSGVCRVSVCGGGGREGRGQELRGGEGAELDDAFQSN